MTKKIIAQIRNRGEVTIPKKIREEMGWKEKDYLVLNENKDGTVTIKKIDL